MSCSESRKCRLCQTCNHLVHGEVHCFGEFPIRQTSHDVVWWELEKCDQILLESALGSWRDWEELMEFTVVVCQVTILLLFDWPHHCLENFYISHTVLRNPSSIINGWNHPIVGRSPYFSESDGGELEDYRLEVCLISCCFLFWLICCSRQRLFLEEQGDVGAAVDEGEFEHSCCHTNHGFEATNKNSESFHELSGWNFLQPHHLTEVSRCWFNPYPLVLVVDQEKIFLIIMGFQKHC